MVAIWTTDHFLLVQYLYWFNPGIVLTAGGFLVAGWALKRLAGVRKAARLTAVLFLIALATMAGRELGVFRVIGNLTSAEPPKGKTLRVSHWNASLFDVPAGVDIGERLAVDGSPDLVFISIQNNPRLWEQIIASMRTAEYPQVLMVNAGINKVFSRFPVTATPEYHIAFTGKDEPEIPAAPRLLRRTLRWLFRNMQVHDRSPDEIEDATVMALTFDTTAKIGRKTTAWFIDMPSNPLASRADLVARVVSHTDTLRKEGKLPAPDFVVGDFNIPLGSESLRAFVPGFSEASASAGLGRLASWPRPRAVLQIDHVLVSPAWRAADYRVIDGGASEHMAQTVRLWPADTLPSSGASK